MYDLFDLYTSSTSYSTVTLYQQMQNMKQYGVFFAVSAGDSDGDQAARKCRWSQRTTWMVLHGSHRGIIRYQKGT